MCELIQAKLSIFHIVNTSDATFPTKVMILFIIFLIEIPSYTLTALPSGIDFCYWGCTALKWRQKAAPKDAMVRRWAPPPAICIHTHTRAHT